MSQSCDVKTGQGFFLNNKMNLWPIFISKAGLILSHSLELLFLQPEHVCPQIRKHSPLTHMEMFNVTVAQKDLIYEFFPAELSWNRNRKGKIMIELVHLENTLKFLLFFFFSFLGGRERGSFVVNLYWHLLVGLWVQTSCCIPCVCVNKPTISSINAWAVNSTAVMHEWDVCVCACGGGVWWAGTSRQPAVAGLRPGIPEHHLSNLRKCQDQCAMFLFFNQKQNYSCMLKFDVLGLFWNFYSPEEMKLKVSANNYTFPSSATLQAGKPRSSNIRFLGPYMCALWKWKGEEMKTSQSENFVLLHCVGCLPGAIFLLLSAS